jgi:uncharacterized protein
MSDFAGEMPAHSDLREHCVLTTNDRVTDNPERNRYEMPLDAKSGGGLAFVAYHRNGDVLTLDHAEVPPALEGQGVGSRLVEATLEDIRARGLKVIPRCGFVRAFLRRHPEFNDLLA